MSVRQKPTRASHVTGDLIGSDTSDESVVPPWVDGVAGAAGVTNRATTIKRWAALHFGVQVVKVSCEAVAGALALLHLARSATFTSERLSHDGGGSELRRETDDHVLVYRIDGPLFFAVSQRFLEEFASVGDVRVVILRLADVQGMDASAAHALGQIVDHLERRGITVLLKGAQAEHHRMLEAVGSLDRLAHEHHVFDDLPAAVAHARRHMDRSLGHDVA